MAVRNLKGASQVLPVQLAAPTTAGSDDTVQPPPPLGSPWFGGCTALAHGEGTAVTAAERSLEW